MEDESGKLRQHINVHLDGARDCCIFFLSVCYSANRHLAVMFIHVSGHSAVKFCYTL